MHLILPSLFLLFLVACIVVVFFPLLYLSVCLITALRCPYWPESLREYVEWVSQLFAWTIAVYALITIELFLMLSAWDVGQALATLYTLKGLGQ